MNIASPEQDVHPAIRRISRLIAISKATAGLVECLPGCTDEDFEKAIDTAVDAFKLGGNSAARSIFMGYEVARNNIKARAKK